MILVSIVIDTLAAYLLRRFFSSTLLHLLLGGVAGAISAIVGSLVAGIGLDESLGVVVLRALSGPPHILFIYIFVFSGVWFDKRRARKKATLEAMKAEDRYWEEHEVDIINEILNEHKSMDLSVPAKNEVLEENLGRLSTEDIVERIQKKHFSEDAIPSALRVLKNRLKA
jgi:hypothetical protein